jgi:4-hydroxy-tetrahydrodipicolinate synthase
MGKTLEGIIVPVVTPFDKNEDVDEKALRGMVNFLIASGVHGLFPAGTQGEFYALSTDEKKRVMDITIEEAAGRVFVMPNTGGTTTREALILSRHAEASGADAISVITPYFISPSGEELRRYFSAVANAVKIPVLAYNNPDRSGVKIPPQTMAQVASECANFVGVKDSSGDLTNTLEYLRLCPPGFRTFMGRDTIIYPALASGCVGAVAATANVAPRIVVGIYESYKAGKHAEALAYQRRLAPLRVAFQLGTFPVVAKEALAMQGRIPDGRARAPVAPLSEEARARLRATLKEMGEL